MNFLTLITRCGDEPFLEEFVDYYLNEGVNMIYILDDSKSIPIPLVVKKNAKVRIIRSEKFAIAEMRDANKLYTKIRGESVWFIFVDCDEFIATKKNKEKTIAQEIRDTFSEVDCIKIPWVMMASGGRKQDPESLLNDLVYRWNHDLRHPHPNGWNKGRCRYHEIEVKCIFKGAAIDRLSAHIPRNISASSCVNSVDLQTEDWTPFYQNLREVKIAKALFLCYHYRIVSEESIIRKTTDSHLIGYQTAMENLILSDHSDQLDYHMRDRIRNQRKKS